MAPLLTRLPSGKYAARSFIAPRLRVTIGHFDSRKAAYAADEHFRATGVLPKGVKPLFR